MEVPVQQIRGDLAYFALVRTIFLGFDTANQSQLFHESLHSLVIQKNPSVAKRKSDTPVAISSSIFVINGSNRCFYICILVRLVQLLCMIVEGCTGQLSDFKQKKQRILLP